jgi:hypothetical protein
MRVSGSSSVTGVSDVVADAEDVDVEASAIRFASSIRTSV